MTLMMLRDAGMCLQREAGLLEYRFTRIRVLVDRKMNGERGRWKIGTWLPRRYVRDWAKRNYNVKRKVYRVGGKTVSTHTHARARAHRDAAVWKCWQHATLCRTRCYAQLTSRFMVYVVHKPIARYHYAWRLSSKTTEIYIYFPFSPTAIFTFIRLM